MTIDVPDLLGGIGGLLGGGAAVYVGMRAKSIERYRAKLVSEGYEHEVRFAHLHERRVEVIADLYTKLVEAEMAFGSWVRLLQMAGEPSMSEKAQRAAKAGEDFQTAFLRGRIWLDEDLCERLDVVSTTLYETFVDFTTYNPDDPRTTTEHHQAWKSAWGKVAQDVPPLRKEVEKRFREMLGVLGSP